jgi:hypothetical protein
VNGPKEARVARSRSALVRASTPCWALAPAFVLAAAGCADAGGSASLLAERDSSGVQILEVDHAAPTWHLPDEPLLSVGVVEGTPEEQFHGVGLAARLADGTLVVFDRGTMQLRRFSDTGRYEGSLGGPGEGPGELRSAQGLVVDNGDTVSLYDSRNRRIWRVPPGAAAPVEARIDLPGAHRFLGLLDGRAVFHASTPTVPGAARWERVEAAAPVVAVSLSSDPPLAGDTILTLTDRSRVRWTTLDQGLPVSVAVGPLPWSVPTLAVVTSTHIVTLEEGRPEFRYHRSDGTLERIVRVPGLDAGRIGGSERSAYIALTMERYSGDSPGEAEASARERVALLDDDHPVPVFDALVAATDGALWLRRHRLDYSDASPHLWIVVGPDGTLTGRIELPARLRPLHARGRVLTGVLTDEMDVERVVVYEIAG